jgi:2-keto-4-pentenoate hydratase
MPQLPTDPALCPNPHMPTAPHIAPIVQALVEARRTGQPSHIASQHPGLTPDEAYEVQGGVAKQLGWFTQRPLAWKVGGHPAPSAAPLPEVLNSPGHAVAPPAGDVLVEAELAFRLARTPTGAEDVLACLGTVCVSIEWIATRLSQGRQASAAWKLADQGVHGGLVIGHELPCEAMVRFTLDQWQTQACSLSVNGAVRSAVRGAHPSVNPLLALPWLVAHAAAHAGALQAGDLITTGACIVTTAQPGDLIEASFDGVGTCCLQLR